MNKKMLLEEMAKESELTKAKLEETFIVSIIFI
jgi:hypothetical protein